ncbi:hypothetical protein ACIRA0001_0102 [Acinetobacter radioresistens SK82]|uniref:Uncharacterized protein n=1 Tax=Acinetobacter radioresistens SK82 TaxID=596318 RepID=A0ABM9YK66_ACIRA|nr:hypothetical protein ACIRA0001_0102 [Acinetobacter radioresistens SK82]
MKTKYSSHQNHHYIDLINLLLTILVIYRKYFFDFLLIFNENH